MDAATLPSRKPDAPSATMPATCLRTARLLIRDLHVDDVPEYAAIVADPAVTRYLSADGSPHTRQQAEAYIRDCIGHRQRHGYARYAVTLAAEGRLLGLCGFKQLNGDVDLGWRYARAFWNQGHATAAGRAVLAYGFEQLALAEVVCTALTANTASLRVIEKLGLRFQRIETLQPSGLRSWRYALDRQSYLNGAGNRGGMRISSIVSP